MRISMRYETAWKPRLSAIACPALVGCTVSRGYVMSKVLAKYADSALHTAFDEDYDYDDGSNADDNEYADEDDGEDDDADDAGLVARGGGGGGGSGGGGGG
ncbi:hypothetical protein AK812_SmicGene16857 [Symbiodinium microadriaticum]|uniref:Uncharacterized protein n=1 Tax=Symbiodinium microadriaticum TaxID=2951 RepID=A0A1Q9DZ71_SYMMI|nr:hypothetical protein AK812_SmicGene16857 [Symbiodinium microadriaticum]